MKGLMIKAELIIWWFQFLSLKVSEFNFWVEDVVQAQNWGI